MLRQVGILTYFLIAISSAKRHQRFPSDNPRFPLDDGNYTLQTTQFQENVVRVGDKTSLFRQKCVNELCTTCVDNTCFNSTGFGALKITENCPLAACLQDCSGFVMDKDRCPTCKCNGFATREPCSNDSDCPSKTCTNSLCVYPAVSDDLNRYCDLAFECPENQDCVDSSCTVSDKEHLENVSCVFDFMCPTNYSCTNMTCWKTGADHLFGGQCIFNRMCPVGYKCHKMTCYKNNSNNNNTSACISDFDCSKDQVCFESICKNMTDLPRRGGGRFPLFQVGGGPDNEDENNPFYNN